jgi:hypothetical protein
MKFPIVFAVALITITALSCGKDKFKTQPQIEIKSINNDVIARDQTLTIQLRFTDKEGDLADGQFVYIPKRLNTRPLLPTVPNYDSVKLVIPKFPDETDGEFSLSLPWLNLHKSDTENDTITMRFVVVDRANNKSDTVGTDKLVILKN